MLRPNCPILGHMFVACRLADQKILLKGRFGVNSPLGPLHHDFQPNTPTEAWFPWSKHRVKLEFSADRLSAGAN